MITIETSRLILRDWIESDIGHCSVHNDDVIKYLLSVKNNYAITLKQTGEIIGTIGINEDAEENPERRNLGFRLLEEYWNIGLMSEALAAVIRSAHRIIPCLSYVHKVNDLRSKHIAEKFGFQYVKTIKNVQRDPLDIAEDFMYYILDVQCLNVKK